MHAAPSPRVSLIAMRKRRGFSLIELLIVITIILIIAAIATINVTRSGDLAREQAAIRQIATLHQAESQYTAQYGKYAASLAELGPPANGVAGPDAADLIPKNLAEGKNNGYVFSVAAIPGGYAITAVPETFGATGNRSFYSNQSMVISQSTTPEPAHADSPPIK
jgi:type IV pilus assembly protein PilA